MTNGSCQSTAESNVQPYRKPLSSAAFIPATTSRAGGSVCSTTPKSMPPPFLDEVLVEVAAEELPVARATVETRAVDDDLPARQHGVDLAGQLHALVRRVVHVHVVRGRRQ